jgi:hypothetical protein
MLRKSGTVSRVVDLRIDAAAKMSAQAVRAARNNGATERFLSRFLDHLHTVDNARDCPNLDSPGRRRGRKRTA